MSNFESITEFLGWCTVLNIGLLAFLTVMLASSAGDWAKRVHGELFRVSKDSVDPMYFNFLANYKLAIIVLNIVPYIALKIIN